MYNEGTDMYIRGFFCGRILHHVLARNLRAIQLSAKLSEKLATTTTHTHVKRDAQVLFA